MTETEDAALGACNSSPRVMAKACAMRIVTARVGLACSRSIWLNMERLTPLALASASTLGELLQAPSAASSVSVIRGDDHAYHYRSDKNCVVRTLSPLNLEKDVEFYEVQLQPGGALRSAAHFGGTREFITVQKGQVRVESASDAETLNAGDSASYRADVPHAMVNTGRGEAVVFLVDIYR